MNRLLVDEARLLEIPDQWVAACPLRAGHWIRKCATSLRLFTFSTDESQRRLHRTAERHFLQPHLAPAEYPSASWR